MKKLYVCLTLWSVFMLYGCFDSSKNTTKDNTDGSKWQMQEGKAEENKWQPTGRKVFNEILPTG